MKRLLICACIMAMLAGVTACNTTPAESEVSTESSASSTAEDSSTDMDDSSADVVNSDSSEPDTPSSSEDNSAASTTGGKGNNPATTTTKSTKAPTVDDIPDVVPPPSIPTGDTKFYEKLNLKGATLKKLTWYDPGDAEKKIDSDYAKIINCKFQYVRVEWGQMQNRVAASIVSNDPIDIGWMHGADFPSAVIRNNYQDITKYCLSNAAYDKNHPEKGGLDIENMQRYSWGGKMYGFVGIFDTYDFNYQVVYYNKKMIKDADLTDPLTLYKQGKWDWDTYYDYAKKFTDISKNRYGIANYGQGVLGKIWVYANDTQLVHYVNGKPTSNITDPKVINAMKFYKKLTNGNTRVSDPGASTNTFVTGQSVFHIQMLSAFNDLYDQMSASVKNNWDLVPIPLGPDNKTGSYPGSWLGAYALTRGSKKGDAVAGWFIYMSQVGKTESYSDKFTKEQLTLLRPNYKKINMWNHAFGKIDDYWYGIDAEIVGDSDVTQIAKKYDPMFNSEIVKTLSQQ